MEDEQRKEEEKKEQPWKKKEEKKEQPTHLVGEISDEGDVYVETMYHIVSENKLRPYEVSLDLCNEPNKFEIDTGVA